MAYIVRDLYGDIILTSDKPIRGEECWIYKGGFAKSEKISESVAHILTDGHIPTFDEEPVPVGKQVCALDLDDLSI